MQKITPFLWFDKEAEEAAKFYVSVFRDSRIVNVTHYTEGGPMPKGSVMTVDFELDGVRFTALNAGPHHQFNEAISFTVRCESQQEVDEFWSKLTAGGGQEVQCGWLKDKFGLSWQVTPTALMRMLGDPDRKKAGRVMQAMMGMKKIDIAGLQRAYDAA